VARTELMDSDRFIAELRELFDDFPNSDRPSGRRFDDIIAVVPNLSTENTLALLNAAASVLASGETYVEVGSYMDTQTRGTGGRARAYQGGTARPVADPPDSRWATRAGHLAGPLPVRAPQSRGHPVGVGDRVGSVSGERRLLNDVRLPRRRGVE